MTIADGIGITLLIMCGVVFLLFSVAVIVAVIKEAKRQQKIDKLRNDLLRIMADVQKQEDICKSYIQKINGKGE